MRNKVFALLFSILFAAASLTAASGETEALPTAESAEQEELMALPPIPDDLTGGKPWIDSTIVGNVTADTQTSPTEDFYLYVNKDWILSHELPAGSQTTERDGLAEPRKRLRAALTGKELAGHDARQAQLFVKAFCDTDAREAAGCAPARQVIDDIRALKSIDEMSEFLLDTERSAGVPTLVSVVNTRNSEKHCWETEVRLSDSTFGSSPMTLRIKNAATISPSDPIYRTRLALVCDVLTRAGYTEEEAKAAFENRLNLEKELIQATKAAAYGQEAPAEYTIDQLDGIAGGFPLRALAQERGYGQAPVFEVYDMAELKAAVSVYTEDHLEALRDYFICGYAIEAGGWLDAQAYDAWIADYTANGGEENLMMPERNTTVEEKAVNLASAVIATPVGRAYVEAYDLAHTKAFMKQFSVEAVEAHKQIVNESQWLSEASKRRLCEKLDNVTLNVVYPDAWEDYSGLDLDGLDYYEARRAIWLNDLARNAALTGTEIDDRLWDLPSLMSAGAYHFDDNSFHADAAACEDDVARYEAGETTLSEFMGGFTGYLVFHEIAHAIDTENIYVDKYGNNLEEPLLEPDDLREYQRRADKAEACLDSITIWEGQRVQGSVCVNEAVAEICAMQARLAYAAKHEGFDYKAFFEGAAGLGPELNTPEHELIFVLGGDTHPTKVLNVNLTVQQFDAFMDTYGVKEGDGMYLAPEDRIVIW